MLTQMLTLPHLSQPGNKNLWVVRLEGSSVVGAVPKTSLSRENTGHNLHQTVSISYDSKLNHPTKQSFQCCWFRSRAP